MQEQNIKKNHRFLILKGHDVQNHGTDKQKV